MKAQATLTITWDMASPDEYDESVGSWQEAAQADWEAYFSIESEIDTVYDIPVIELLGDPDTEPFERCADEDVLENLLEPGDEIEGARG